MQEDCLQSATSLVSQKLTEPHNQTVSLFCLAMGFKAKGWAERRGDLLSQGYPMDLERSSESSLRVCFARPLKQNDPRSRAPQQGRPVQGPGGGEGLRLTGNRGERNVREPSPGYRTVRLCLLPALCSVNRSVMSSRSA